jgi:hypothetical protein
MCSNIELFLESDPMALIIRCVDLCIWVIEFNVLYSGSPKLKPI